MTSRRSFLHSLAGASAAATLPAFKNDGLERAYRMVDQVGKTSAADLAADEEFWFGIQQAFTVDRSLVNLNNGGVSPSPRVVQDAMTQYLAYSNQAPVYTMWRVLEPQIEGVRKRLALAFGCDPEEMAITRNASEALEIVQLGLDLKPGDEVLTTDQDYGRMLTTWDQRVRREGIVLKKIPFTCPPRNPQALVDAFAAAIGPKTRVLHFCHITNLSGQIFPVKQLMRLAKDRGLEAIVDGAHAFAHFPFQRDDLDCDYYGTSLHKWLLAPIGTGFLYVRKNKIPGIWPMMAAAPNQANDIRKFEEIGTHPAANHNAISEALTFHEGIGSERKAARLRYLRDRWMTRLAALPRVKIYTSTDAAQSCAIGNVSVDGVDTGKIGSFLWDSQRIIVTPIGHPACPGLRVTPNVYTTLEEVDRFATAMELIAKNGLT
jgi:selenocysteine lyase/cysteine desulfurase